MAVVSERKVSSLYKRQMRLLYLLAFASIGNSFVPGSYHRSIGVASTYGERKHLTKDTDLVSHTHQQCYSGSRTGLFMKGGTAIEQLSEECLEALKIAQDMGNTLGLDTLRIELMFAGVVERPERAQNVLDKNGFTLRNVRKAVESSLKPYSKDRPRNPEEKLEALPFSPEAKRVLDQACSIADHLGSQSSVRSEHVLLALMGYNYGKLIDTAPIFPVLKDIKGLNKGFRVFQFCQDLVQDLNEQPNQDVTMTTRQVVVGGSSSTSTATLKQVGVDLTEMALQGKLDRVYGRDNEIRSALRTLGRRRKNNPVLIGEPGVGKTAVAEGIAQVLATALAVETEQKSFQMPKVKNPFRKEDEPIPETEIETDEYVYTLPACPQSLAGARLISVDLASLVAGTENRGTFEKRVQNLVREASANNVILFIDEIHQLVGAGGDGAAMSAANLLKPALSRGELRLLGATTTPEYRRYIEKDGALERRFQPLEVREPTVDESINILASIISQYEQFHGVEYTNNALVTAAKLSDRYVSDRFLPDKAIDMLDEAGSMAKMMADPIDENVVVTEDDVRQILAEITGIPVGRLETGEKERLRNMEQILGQRIKGQLPAVKSVSKPIRRARSGMRDARRPVSTFLFCGPTGVGKTELCKALAEAYFGQEKDMIRIDMSEYMDRFSVSRLVGAPPGYVGYEEGGQLTEAVRRSPHSVILFDEMEKAHDDVLNLLLQVTDDGILTDGKGRRVSFKNTIIVMTTNIGSKRILELSRDPDAASSATNDAVKAELEAAMKPELLNRIDEVIVFSPLSYDNLRDITMNIIDDARKRAAEENEITLTVSDSVAEAITREGLTVASQFGARPIRRAVQRYLEDTMAEAIIKEFVNEGDEVKVELEQAAADDKPALIRITKNFSNGSSFGESMTVPVDSTSSSELDIDFLAFGDLPGLDDSDEPPPRETDTFQ